MSFPVNILAAMLTVIFRRYVVTLTNTQQAHSALLLTNNRTNMGIQLAMSILAVFVITYLIVRKRVRNLSLIGSNVTCVASRFPNSSEEELRISRSLISLCRYLSSVFLSTPSFSLGNTDSVANLQLLGVTDDDVYEFDRNCTPGTSTTDHQSVLVTPVCGRNVNNSEASMKRCRERRRERESVDSSNAVDGNRSSSISISLELTNEEVERPVKRRCMDKTTRSGKVYGWSEIVDKEEKRKKKKKKRKNSQEENDNEDSSD